MALQITKSTVYMTGSTGDPVDYYLITADDRNAYTLNDLYDVIEGHGDFDGNTNGTSVTPSSNSTGRRVFNIAHLSGTQTLANGTTGHEPSTIAVDSSAGFSSSGGFAWIGSTGQGFSYGGVSGNTLTGVSWSSGTLSSNNSTLDRRFVLNDEIISPFINPAIINCAFTLTDQRPGETIFNFVGGGRVWLNLIGGGTDQVSTQANGAYSSGTTFTVDSTALFLDASSTNPQTAFVGTDEFTYTGLTATTFTGVTGLGAVADNASVTQPDGRAIVTLGKADFETPTGFVTINYQQPPADFEVAAWDNETQTDSRTNQQEYYILGRSHGTITMPNTEAPILTINFNAQHGWSRYDMDIGFGDVNGVASFAANLWQGPNLTYPHSGAGDGLTFSSGTQLYQRNASLPIEIRPVVQPSQDVNVGAQKRDYPNAYVTNTQITANSNQVNTLHPGVYTETGGVRTPTGGGARYSGRDLWTIYDYPYTGYNAQFTGNNSTFGRQEACYFINPQTNEPTNITQRGVSWHMLNGNIFFSSAYQPRFLREDETESDDGAVIRIRNNALPVITGTNVNFTPTASEYIAQPIEFNNYEWPAYGYNIDKSSTGGNKNGYLLHWGLSPNTNSTSSSGAGNRAQVFNYTGSFDTIHCGPGFESVEITKTPLPSSGQCDRNVSDTIVADTILGYSNANRLAAPINYGQASIPSNNRIYVAGGTTTISSISGSTITVADGGVFFPGATGGTFYHGNQRFNYTGVSGNTITGISPTGVLSNGDTVAVFELRFWQTANASVNLDQWASSVVSFPWQTTVDFYDLTNANKTTRKDQYIHLWESIGAYNGNVMTLTGSEIEIKNRSNLHPSTLEITSGNVPTKGTQYDTIGVNRTTSTPGWTDLNNVQLDCTTAGANHAFIRGNCNGLYTTTSYPTLNQYAMRGNTKLEGIHTIPRPASGDVYVQYIDCERDGTFSVIGSGTGSGTVRVIGAPGGTNFSPASWVVPVSSLTITTPPLSREARTTTSAAFVASIDSALQLTDSNGFDVNGGIAYANGDEFTYTGITGNNLTGVSGLTDKPSGASVDNGTGRLTAYTSSGTEIGSFTSASTSGFTVQSDGTVEYVFSSSSHTNLPPASGGTPPQITIVWSGPGGRDSRFTVGFEDSVQTTQFTRGEAEVSSVTALPSGVTVSSASSISGGILTWRVSGARGGSIPSTAQTWYLVDNFMRGTALYNSFLRASANNVNSMRNNGHYAQVDGDLVRMTPQESNTQSVGYIQNLSDTDPVTPIGTPLGSFDFNIAADPPGINPRVIEDALIAFNAATQQDVNNARNVVLGNL